MQKNYILIGAAGFVAPRHLKAIKETGGNLVAAYDPCDSVGILDSHFPDCKFFTTMEELELWLDLQTVKIDYVSICSPNYLHVPHIAFGLRIGADVICEKPLCLTGEEIEQIAALESKFGGKVWTILQLRLHPEIKKLQAQIEQETAIHRIQLTYTTPRGDWYAKSWKANPAKSGGVLTNIGVHLFDMLIWVFGPPITKGKAYLTENTAAGVLHFDKASVTFNLSIKGDKPERSMTIDDRPIDFTGGFTELHTESYWQILDGNGFGIQEAATAIKLIEGLRG